MDVIKCINERRSIRNYTDEIIPMDTMEELLTIGTKAANGSGQEPWGFVVIQGKDQIDALSEMSKKDIMSHYDELPYLKRYESWISNPKVNVFNRASNLLLIYGNTDSHWYTYDCSMAAGNIMLAAHDMGIGTCWCGFGAYTMNQKEIKEKHGVPDNYELVSCMSMGYMKAKLEPPVRKAPVIFNRE